MIEGTKKQVKRTLRKYWSRYYYGQIIAWLQELTLSLPVCTVLFSKKCLLTGLENWYVQLLMLPIRTVGWQYKLL